MEIKHKKHRNTLFLYQILMNKVTTVIIGGQDKKLNEYKYVINKYFKPGTEINKQLKLYKELVDNQKSFKSVIEKFKKTINCEKLQTQKYNLIKEINNKFPDFELYIKQTTVNNYRLYASIYKLFNYYGIQNKQYRIDDNILHRQKLLVLQHKNKDEVDYSLKQFDGYNNDLKLFVYRVILDKFNKKYSGLSMVQKKILFQYLNNNSYNIIIIANKLYQKLGQMNQIDNKVINSKLDAVAQKLKTVINSKFKINENHIKLLMVFTDLLQQVKKLK